MRTSSEVQKGSIESAKHIDVDTIRDNLDKFPKDKNEKIYIFCQVGLRGYIAAMILKNNGYKMSTTYLVDIIHIKHIQESFMLQYVKSLQEF